MKLKYRSLLLKHGYGLLLEPVHRMVLGVIYVHDTGISMLVAEIFLKSLIKLMESIYILSILTMDHFMIP